MNNTSRIRHEISGYPAPIYQFTSILTRMFSRSVCKISTYKCFKLLYTATYLIFKSYSRVQKAYLYLHFHLQGHVGNLSHSAIGSSDCRIQRVSLHPKPSDNDINMKVLFERSEITYDFVVVHYSLQAVSNGDERRVFSKFSA